MLKSTPHVPQYQLRYRSCVEVPYEFRTLAGISVLVKFFVHLGLGDKALRVLNRGVRKILHLLHGFNVCDIHDSYIALQPFRCIREKPTVEEMLGLPCREVGFCS